MKNLSTVKKEIAQEVRLTLEFIAESKKRNDAFEEGLKKLADTPEELEQLKRLYDELNK